MEQVISMLRSIPTGTLPLPSRSAGLGAIPPQSGCCLVPERGPHVDLSVNVHTDPRWIKRRAQQH